MALVTTDRGIKALKPTGSRYTATVSTASMAAGGLLVRVGAAGQKVFYSRLRQAGKQIDIRHGVYPAVSLKEAVEAHNEAFALAQQGIDPRIHKATIKAEREAEITMDQLVGRWLEHLQQQPVEQGGVKPSTIKAHRWRWGKYLAEQLGSMKATSIRRPHLAAALDKVRRQAKEETRKCLSTLNLALDYALPRGMIEENPARLLKPKDFLASPNKSQSRWLTLPELSQLWDFIDNGPHQTSLQIENIIKISILTGCRRSEASNMQWSELDLQAATWTLPAERSKNGQAHTFFLHPLAVDLLKQLEPISRSVFVFESPVIKEGKEPEPVSANAVTRAVNRISTRLDFPSFSIHDLRRTAATHWADTLDADTGLVELMLNHLPSDKLVQTYQKGKKLDQQKKVWLRWGNLLESIINQTDEDSTNVVPMTGRAGA